jgi:hypothetical protein
MLSIKTKVCVIFYTTFMRHVSAKVLKPSSDEIKVFQSGLMHVVAQLVEHFVTSRKIAGSIPDGVTGICH